MKWDRRVPSRGNEEEELSGSEVAHLLSNGNAFSVERAWKPTKAERKALKRKRPPGFAPWA